MNMLMRCCGKLPMLACISGISKSFTIHTPYTDFYVTIIKTKRSPTPTQLSNTHHQAVLHPNPSHTVVQQQLVCTSFSELLLQSSQFLP
ncbi:hypothetical protein JHK87_007778 [Glycine soja]|nr:hypothetical protein JHK87_007778 [Glycine soja]